ncbi:MAG TPA: DUF4331 family protein [Gemmatimonadales bacterium]|nr:DUF4331 family protein [Gemmatimonadales bacterium]
MKARPALLALGAVALAAAGVAVRQAVGSDHQDTPEVELSPRSDINDVYAFPGSSDSRIVLVMTTSSPLTPAQSAAASFDQDLLYQFKVDNSGDGVEDLVLQFTFEGEGSNQRVVMRGPTAPAMTGMRSRVVNVTPALSGTINTNLGSASGIQLFAGVRDDPFFLDLEQFFRIIPDRRPVTGALSQLPDTPTASGFRNPGVDYLSGFNALAIVVELPESMLTGAGTGRIGLWGTISR